MGGFNINPILLMTLLARGGAVKYTNCISAEGQDSASNKNLGYDTKVFDGEAPILELWQMSSLLHCYYSQVHSGPDCFYVLD